MSAKFILSLDPSGAFHEGKGTTGWCIMSDESVIIEKNHISATLYISDHAYWKAHIELIEQKFRQFPSLEIVMEDYLLYANKASDQINSRFETVQLIGVIRYACLEADIPVHIQTASQVKSRWANEILEHKGVIVKCGKSYRVGSTGQMLNRHEIDSIRHAMHFTTFYNKEK